jgi:hypothetical protein
MKPPEQAKPPPELKEGPESFERFTLTANRLRKFILATFLANDKSVLSGGDS